MDSCSRPASPRPCTFSRPNVSVVSAVSLPRSAHSVPTTSTVAAPSPERSPSCHAELVSKPLPRVPRYRPCGSSGRPHQGRVDRRSSLAVRSGRSTNPVSSSDSIHLPALWSSGSRSGPKTTISRPRPRVMASSWRRRLIASMPSLVPDAGPTVASDLNGSASPQEAHKLGTFAKTTLHQITIPEHLCGHLCNLPGSKIELLVEGFDRFVDFRPVEMRVFERGDLYTTIIDQRCTLV